MTPSHAGGAYQRAWIAAKDTRKGLSLRFMTSSLLDAQPLQRLRKRLNPLSPVKR